MNSILGIFFNPALRAAFFGWFFAQFLKVPIYYISDRKWCWSRAMSAGGMPSSHSASICAATTTIGMIEGFSSSVFALAAVISMVVMYDAAGVRRAAGKHAEKLNEISALLRGEVELTDEKLKELLGHTPFEVLMGAWLGVAIGIIVSLFHLRLR